jgi:hypothetical protein
MRVFERQETGQRSRLSPTPACPTIVSANAKRQRGSGGRGPVITLCSQCDKPEAKCTCEKYCCFCQSQQNIRMGIDGLYYCPDCREACDVPLAEADEH